MGSGFHTEVSGSNGPTTRMNLYPAGYGCYSDDKPVSLIDFLFTLLERSFTCLSESINVLSLKLFL